MCVQRMRVAKVIISHSDSPDGLEAVPVIQLTAFEHSCPVPVSQHLPADHVHGLQSEGRGESVDRPPKAPMLKGIAATRSQRIFLRSRS